MSDKAKILLVDDRQDNLLALEAILEPLREELVYATSGEEALRQLLTHEIAVILLDVQMPGLDGFETAGLIKQRERTKAIPIIFLTAISKEEQHVFRGYSAGAVDYLFKPFNPDVLRSKVAVFIELHHKTDQLRRQAEQLKEQELAELRRESEERYRFLAEAAPDQIWTALPDGQLDYVNQRVLDYFGRSFEDMVGSGWTDVVHPDDLAATLERWSNALETGERYESEFRLRRTDDMYRWHLVRAMPQQDRTGRTVKWFGSNTDIEDQKRAEEAQRFLVEAGAVLGGSLDYATTLRSVAKLAVPRMADWVRVDMVDRDGELRTLAVEHVDERKVAFVRELAERADGPGVERGAASVMDTGTSELVPEFDEASLDALELDEIRRSLVRELGLTSYMCVPLVARDLPVGAITFVSAESGRRYDESDLALAEELARRAGTAVENAQLYREVEEQAQASQVLDTVGDGVVLVDGDGVIRLWNPAAEGITGIPTETARGRQAEEVLPGFTPHAPRAPSGSSPGAATSETFPIELNGMERWLSISGVDFEGGTVYAFRDLTEERGLEAMRQDLVATVSHELRTPLAAIYGSALTLRRTDLELEAQMQSKLLEIIADESSRLADIVNDLLLASQLDSGKLQVQIGRCDAEELTRNVTEAARTHLPTGTEVAFEPPNGSLPPVAADAGQLRQVLVNLVDNAIKYSPDGGTVRVTLTPAGRYLRFAVADEGLGIPQPEQRRIFEKFYRLDPGMTRGIGGTGLGLYICRELVRRVEGKIWVESNNGSGSVFYVEIPTAPVDEKPARKQRNATSKA